MLGDAEVYAELMVNRRESSQVGYRQLSLDYVKGSPLIPAGLAASSFSGPQATSGGLPVGVRAFIGFGNTGSSQTVDFVRAAAGIRGQLGNTGWDYDVSLTHADSDGSYSQDSFLTSRLTQATNVVASANGKVDFELAGLLARPSFFLNQVAFSLEEILSLLTFHWVSVYPVVWLLLVFHHET
jgi:iron complex outermembrane receptor protein